MKELIALANDNRYTELLHQIKSDVEVLCSTIAAVMTKNEIKEIELSDTYKIKVIRYNDFSKIIVLSSNQKEYFLADTDCSWDGYDKYNGKYDDYYMNFGLEELSTELSLWLYQIKEKLTVKLAEQAEAQVRRLEKARKYIWVVSVIWTIGDGKRMSMPLHAFENEQDALDYLEWTGENATHGEWYTKNKLWLHDKSYKKIEYLE